MEAGHGQFHPARPGTAIVARAEASGETSYTRKLIDRGIVDRARNLREGAVEVVVAAARTDRQRVIAEDPADLL